MKNIDQCHCSEPASSQIHHRATKRHQQCDWHVAPPGALTRLSPGPREGMAGAGVSPAAGCLSTAPLPVAREYVVFCPSPLYQPCKDISCRDTRGAMHECSALQDVVVYTYGMHHTYVHAGDAYSSMIWLRALDRASAEPRIAIGHTGSVSCWPGSKRK